MTSAERSPLYRKSLRIGLTVLYIGLAAQNFVNGARHPQSRVLDFVLGVLFLFCSVMWGLVVTRSLSRMPARMRRLRGQIRERHPGW